MLDLKKIREDSTPFIKAMKARYAPTNQIEEILKFDKKWRKLKKETDELKHERNTISMKINEAKKEGKSIQQIILKTKKIANDIKANDEMLSVLEQKMHLILFSVPNIPDASAPVGKEENSNKEVRKWGEMKKKSGDIIPHYDLGPVLKMMDFERGAKLAGSRFTVLYGQLAKLERALAYYMLEKANENKYLEVSVPLLANSKTMTGTGQLPKFESELYKLQDTDFWLIPTSEVPLVNLHAGEILEESILPLSYCSFSPNFRKEAGNYQKDIKGMIRQHQFYKIELVKFTLPENSDDALEQMVKHAESVMQGLSLPYKVMQLCTGEMGFAASKAYDIEAWLPSQNKYREISSISNCTDFQARRANIKFRREGKNEFVHTLNGTGVAIGRAMVALMENFQDESGIDIPKPLRDFMQTERIEF
ncbi:MAG: serine--tRNA ligase [Candidatus Micrarchaeota archaeon]